MVKSFEDEERSGRPSTSKNDESIEWVQNLVRSDRHLRIQDMENTLGISYGSVQSILKDDLKCVVFVQNLFPEFWPKTKWKTENWLTLNFSNDQQMKMTLSKIVTGDETWVFAYDPETKFQSSEWHTTTSSWPVVQIASF